VRGGIAGRTGSSARVTTFGYNLNKDSRARGINKMAKEKS
jgi:hypothetical protein